MSISRLLTTRMPERDRIVALQNRRVAQISHAVDVEDLLDQERAGENQAEHVAQAGRDRESANCAGRARRSRAACAGLSQTPSARSPATCSPSASSSSESSASRTRRPCSRAPAGTCARSGRTIFCPERQVLPVVRPESSKRKHVPETAAAEQHEQRRSERPARDGVAHEHQHAASRSRTSIRASPPSARRAERRRDS